MIPLDPGVNAIFVLAIVVNEKLGLITSLVTVRTVLFSGATVNVVLHMIKLAYAPVPIYAI